MGDGQAVSEEQLMVVGWHWCQQQGGHKGGGSSHSAVTNPSGLCAPAAPRSLEQALGTGPQADPMEIGDTTSPAQGLRSSHCAASPPGGPESLAAHF